MKTTLIDSTCLNYEQLESYSLNRCEMKERAALYLHISTCELCACAVNGFTAIPFTSAEVDAIHLQIDVKTNGLHASTLTVAQVFIALISVVFIFGFYQFAESFSDKEPKSQETQLSVPQIIPAEEVVIIGGETNSTAKPAAKKFHTFSKKEVPQRAYTMVEPLTSITPDLIPLPAKNDDLLAEPVYNSDVIYIYDLKVTDYNSLYFNYVLKPFELGHTPANKESRGSSPDLFSEGSGKIIAADKTLKAGLSDFSKGKYEDAIAEFSVLLENNSKDVNALFYSAVSYYHLGEYRHTIRDLELVLKSQNNSFYPEAKWNLAMSYLKAGEKHRAKELLSEIVSEKGFYSTRAADKLKALGSL